MFDIDFRSREPIYEQIKKNIIQLIAGGILEVDEQLPPVREVAEKLNINPNTVQKAYKQLDAAEILYTIPGKGSFVASSKSINLYLQLQIEKELTNTINKAIQNNWSNDEILQTVQQIMEKEREKND